MTFGSDNTITGGTNWSATSYDEATATPLAYGGWINEGLENPDAALFGADWNEGNNVYFAEDGAYYAGVWEGDTITGTYNQPDSGSSGTFVATVACDLNCKASKIAG